MLLHRFDAEPRLYVLSVAGMRLDATSAVTVSVSEEALPSVVLPRTERLPERLLVPEVFVELKRPVICTSPSASMRNSSEPFTATPRRTLLVPAEAGLMYTDPWLTLVPVGTARN